MGYEFVAGEARRDVGSVSYESWRCAKDLFLPAYVDFVNSQAPRFGAAGGFTVEGLFKEEPEWPDEVTIVEIDEMRRFRQLAGGIEAMDLDTSPNRWIFGVVTRATTNIGSGKTMQILDGEGTLLGQCSQLDWHALQSMAAYFGFDSAAARIQWDEVFVAGDEGSVTVADGGAELLALDPLEVSETGVFRDGFRRLKRLSGFADIPYVGASRMVPPGASDELPVVSFVVAGSGRELGTCGAERWQELEQALPAYVEFLNHKVDGADSGERLTGDSLFQVAGEQVDVTDPAGVVRLLQVAGMVEAVQLATPFTQIFDTLSRATTGVSSEVDPVAFIDGAGELLGQAASVSWDAARALAVMYSENVSQAIGSPFVWDDVFSDDNRGHVTVDSERHLSLKSLDAEFSRPGGPLDPGLFALHRALQVWIGVDDVPPAGSEAAHFGLR